MTNTAIPLQTETTNTPKIQKQNKRVFLNTPTLIEITNTSTQNTILLNKTLNKTLIIKL